MSTNNITFKNTLNYYQNKIDTELNIFFSKKLRQVNNIHPSSVDIIKKTREFNLRGGKRIRPILVIMGYKCFKNPKDLNEITKAALAVELMESFLLIHDDIIDNDSLRRGKPTLHKIYEETHNKKTNKTRQDINFGKNMAILAGDLLAIFGSEAILSTNFKEKQKLKAAEKFNRVVINTIFGQTIDYLSNFSDDFRETTVNNIHLLKTAKYTLEGPLHIGAILAGANNSKLNKISRFSLQLGRAFQIKDDILGLYGDENKLGKPVGSDIKEGKKTLLIAKALEKSKLKDRNFIKNTLGRSNITKTQLKKIKEIVTTTGSLEYSENLAKSLAEKAKQHIRSSGFRKEASLFLCQLADYIINREY